MGEGGQCRSGKAYILAVVANDSEQRGGKQKAPLSHLFREPLLVSRWCEQQRALHGLVIS
ncbi:hypothetical protein PanWU01x14_119580 [Parasponia andersonii]|uniref:Uncharacterized protein n=1 Tax=Parasponia andersonii TaxID=3476 RepID=A0A2P5CVM4_PARAD|nr:hypothetical protein PanWU01x14_119580 [Parasponia andersonii]